jgi:hypothetical protein
MQGCTVQVKVMCLRPRLHDRKCVKVIRHDSRVELYVLIDRACLSIDFFSVMCGVFIDKMKWLWGKQLVLVFLDG